MYKVNCIGDICPVPVIKTKKALADGNLNELEILVDNEIAVQNISKLLNSLGCSYSAGKENEHFLISVSESNQGVDWDGSSSSDNGTPHHFTPELTPANPSKTEPLELVIISSEFMGTGDNTLGKLLMKGFIFALTQLESLPTSVIFYNSGVYHTLKNSGCISDLQSLHNHGVKILVCGTCLNHFSVLSELAVGEVTNMYEIVSLMQKATGIIRP